MKKIAFVINRIEIGGPSNVIRNIIHNLTPHRFKIYLITLMNNADDKEVVKQLENYGVSYINLAYKSNIDCFNNGKKFEQTVASLNIDIIHSHGFVPDYLASKCKGIIKISTLHCRLFEDYPEVYGKVKGFIFAHFHLNCLKRFTEVVCCSKAVKVHVEKYLESCSFIENGIEPNNNIEVIARSSLGIPDDGVVFIYTGQLRKRKNVVWLIENFVKYHKRNEYLLILGKGSLLNECQKVADENTLILGFKKNVTAYLNMSDIFISASMSEGFSISVLEALSRGLGLLLSDIPSHTEIFEIDSDYYIGEVFNDNTFKSKLQTIRDNYDKISKESISDFMKMYLSAKSMTLLYEKVYEKGRC